MKTTRKTSIKRFTLYKIVLVVLILTLIISAIVSFLINDFYTKKVQDHLQLVEKNFQESQKNVIPEYIQSKKAESEFLLNQIILPIEKADKQLKVELKSKLKEDALSAYNLAHEIYKKYSKTKNKKELQDCIKEALSRMTFKNKSSSVFIKDYKFNTLLQADVKNDNKEHRDIDLESMQKVRKHQEGSLKYVSLSNEEQMLYVKTLGLYDWYIGVIANVQKEKQVLQSNLLKDIKKIPLAQDEFLGVYEKTKALIVMKKLHIDIKSLSKDETWKQVKNSYYSVKYYKPFDWYFVYGFNPEGRIAQIKQQQERQKLTLEKEFSFF